MQTLSYSSLLQNITLLNSEGEKKNTFFFVHDDIKTTTCEFDIKNVKGNFPLYHCCK